MNVLRQSAYSLIAFARSLLSAATIIVAIIGSPAIAADSDITIVQRKALVDELKRRIRPLHVPDDAYLKAALTAIGTVPRHELVPPESRARAYEDAVLEIGYGQTISDPFIVAIMTDLVRIGKTDTVLEVGTGSGYQAAVLGQVAGGVFTIELVEPLAKLAAERLGSLGYHNITVRASDGYAGWPEHAPFDAIIVTAGAQCLPPALVAQLKPGGRIVIPLGRNIAMEELMLIMKRADGALDSQSFGPVIFVDFTGRIERAARIGPYPKRDPQHPLTLCDIATNQTNPISGIRP